MNIQMKPVTQPGRTQAAPPGVTAHLHRFTVEEVNVRLLLIRTLADQHEEGWEVFLCVDGLTAVDGSEGVALQLVLHDE